MAHNPDYSQYISTIFTVPKLAFNPLTEINGIMNEDILARPLNVTLPTLPNSLDGYVPRNQKLRTYPYIYLGFNAPRWVI